jgi:ADP-heptose:LPS heptosyltransferase
MNNKKDFSIKIFDQTRDSRLNNRSTLLLVLPSSAGDIFLVTSLLKSVKEELYPEFDIYFACSPAFKQILEDNPYIYKVIDFHPEMLHFFRMEGQGEWPGIFDISINIGILTQSAITNYTRNGRDRSIFFKPKTYGQELKKQYFELGQ